MRLPLGTSLGPPVAATVTVERVIKKYIAIVTDGKTRFIAKLFPPHTANNPERLLNKELVVYRECACLQGSYIPYLVGVYRAVKGSHFSSPIVLTEDSGTGKTVADLVALAGDLDDQDDISRAETQLALLPERATNTIGTLHRMKVIHADLSGSKMIVVDGGQVVLVDFCFSSVLKDEPWRFKARRDDDLQQLKKAFEVEYY